MAEGGETLVQVIKNAPTTLKADIWAHFHFYAQPGKHNLEKTHAVGKSCHYMQGVIPLTWETTSAVFTLSC